jgi:hypothetical protein
MTILGYLFLAIGGYILFYWLRSISVPIHERPMIMMSTMGPIVTFIAGFVLALIGILFLNA